MKHLKIVDTIQIYNENDLKTCHKQFVSEGYEGTMVRTNDSVKYESNKRSSSLLKYKDFSDMALPIHDVIPLDAKPDQGQFIFYWKGAEGHPYGNDYIGCGMKFSHEERKEILLNKDNYIGKTAELRYFEKSESGVLRFPVCCGIRLDK